MSTTLEPRTADAATADETPTATLEAQLADDRKRAQELEAERETEARAAQVARQHVIARTGDAAAVEIALARQRSLEYTLSDLRTRIAHTEGELARRRQDAERAARQAEAIEAAHAAAETMLAMLEARKNAAADLLANRKVRAYVDARLEAYRAQRRANRLALEVSGDDAGAALAFLEAEGIDARALATPIFPAPRYTGRNPRGVPAEPYFRELPPLTGGELVAIIADAMEFGHILTHGAGFVLSEPED